MGLARRTASALIERLQAELPPDDQEALGLTKPSEFLDLVSTLKGLKNTLNRTPLLIFDQFDDYPTRHREQFVVHNTRLQTNKLIKKNHFWRDIKTVISEKTIAVLIVVRKDMAVFLPSIDLVPTLRGMVYTY